MFAFILMILHVSYMLIFISHNYLRFVYFYAPFDKRTYIKIEISAINITTLFSKNMTDRCQSKISITLIALIFNKSIRLMIIVIRVEWCESSCGTEYT